MDMSDMTFKMVWLIWVGGACVGTLFVIGRGLKVGQIRRFSRLFGPANYSKEANPYEFGVSLKLHIVAALMFAIMFLFGLFETEA
jgi:hypothetical protein